MGEVLTLAAEAAIAIGEGSRADRFIGRGLAIYAQVSAPRREGYLRLLRARRFEQTKARASAREEAGRAVTLLTGVDPAVASEAEALRTQLAP